MAFKNKGIAFIVGAVAGSVVGSVTALLFAPKSGKELRGDIKAGAEKAIEAGSSAIDHVSETVFEVSKKLEDRTAKVVQNAKQGVQQAVAYVKGNKANEETTANTEAMTTTIAEADITEADRAEADITVADNAAAITLGSDKTTAAVVAQSSHTNSTEEAEAVETEVELDAKISADQSEKSNQQKEESIAIVQ